MRYLILLLLNFPVACSAQQLVDHFYNVLFHGSPFTVVSYSQIKKYQIKSISYQEGDFINQRSVKSATGKMQYHADYKVHLSKACFNEMGFPDYCEGEKRDNHWNYYIYNQDSVLYLFKKLEQIDTCSSFKYQFKYTNINSFYVEYDAALKQLQYEFIYTGALDSYSKRNCATAKKTYKTLILDEQFRVIKDSLDVQCTCDDILCTDRKSQTTYRYDSKGNLIELGPEGMVSFSYSENGNLTKMEMGKLFSIDYKYKDQKLSKIQVNNAVKTGLQAIELSFY